MIPIRDTTPDTFAAIRSLLYERGYTTAGILERTDVASLADARDRVAGRDQPAPADALDILLRLLLGEHAVPEAAVDAMIGGRTLEPLERVGVLRRTGGDGGLVEPTVMLYPIEDVYIASDLTRNPADPQAQYALPEDVVYPACTRNTLGFVASLPRTPCARFLELCGGTGVAALIAARSAGIAVTADITERSTRFAAWNAKLNGLTNVRAVCGDLYVPVAGETFDRIATHPPYMPALEMGYVFRDGGEDGEQVTRRILEGLADHLAPGGRFHATCFLTSRGEEPIEQRVRGMLGPRHEAFDVLTVTTALSNVAEYYFRLGLDDDIPLETAERLATRLAELGVEAMVLCTLLVTRPERSGEPVTLRRQRGARMAPEDLERELSIARGTEAVPPAEALKPRLSANARLRVTHVPVNGGWAAETCVVSVDAPFARRIEAAADVAAVLDRCDGSRSVPALFRALVEERLLPESSTQDEFAATVSQLVRDGILEHAG
jgi:SAM-dependent methyltransferase